MLIDSFFEELVLFKLMISIDKTQTRSLFCKVKAMKTTYPESNILMKYHFSDYPSTCKEVTILTIRKKIK